MNSQGQLGDGSWEYHDDPVKVLNLVEIKEISAGANHSLALKSDGTVWQWGSLYYTYFTPQQISNLDGIKSIAAGTHSLALKSDGSVYAWGNNSYGQLGIQTSTAYIQTPLKIISSNVDLVFTGYNNSFVVKSDGTVLGTGYNYFGQLCNGITISTKSFINLPLLEDKEGIKQISAGAYHSLELRNDGTVWAWGNNNKGQLGNGNTINCNSPVKVMYLSDIIEIYACYENSFAIKSDGTVWAWGYNNYGQLGTGNNTDSLFPVKVLTVDGVLSITGKSLSTFVLKADGNVLSWGQNSFGQLGNGTNIDSYTPINVSNLLVIKEISSNSSFSCALKSDGTIWCWGNNGNGQFGDGTYTNSNIPKLINNLTNIKSISAGTGNTLVLKDNGLVFTWGYNIFSETNTPALQTSISGIKSISGGGDFSLALKDDGSLYSWGYNGDGELGIGTSNDTELPVKVAVNNVTFISAGFCHSLIVKADGTLWGAGYNSFGQLGNGLWINSYLFGQVSHSYAYTEKFSWIVSKDINTIYSSSLWSFSMITGLADKFNSLSDNLKLNNNFTDAELNYYFGSDRSNYTTFSDSAEDKSVTDFIINDNLDYITYQSCYFYAKCFSELSVKWNADPNTIYGMNYYMQSHFVFNNFYSNLNSAHVLHEFSQSDSGTCKTTDISLGNYYPYNMLGKNNPMINKTIFLKYPDNFLSIGRWHDSDWSTKDYCYGTSERFDYVSNTYSLFKADETNEVGLTLASDKLKVFSDTENNAVIYNIFNTNFDIQTGHRVKIITAQFYKKDSSGKYIEYDDSITNTINDSNQDGITNLPINKKITESGDYSIIIGIVDKFNKIRIYTPKYFKILNPSLEINYYKFSNDSNNWYSMDDFRNNKINSANDSIVIKLKGIVKNLYEKNIYNIYLGYNNSGLIQYNETKLDLNDKIDNEQYFEYTITFSNDYSAKNFQFDKIYMYFGDSIITTSSTDLSTNMIVNFYNPNLNNINIDNITPAALKLTDDAQTQEYNLWSNDDYRLNSKILEVEESLKTSDFQKLSKLFEIPVTIPENITLLNITLYKGTNKNYFFVFNKTKTNVKIYDTQFNIINLDPGFIDKDADGKILKIRIPVYYEDFFNDSGSNNLFPVNIFNEDFNLTVKGVYLLNNNYVILPGFSSQLITDVDNYINGLTINDMLLFFNNNAETDPNMKSVSCKSPIATKKIVIEPYPSRIVYTNIKRNVNNNEIIDMKIKPALAASISNGRNFSYKIIVVNGSNYKNEEFYSTLLNDTNNSNSLWTYNPVDKYYISNWIVCDSDNAISLGCNEYNEIKISTGITPDPIKYIKDDNTNLDGKVHFFTVIKYNNGTTDAVTSSFRHSAINVNDNLCVIKNPDELFENGDEEINTNFIFTKDIYVPSGKTLKFGYGANMKTKTPQITLDDKIRIIVDGNLIITNDGLSLKPVYLGPTGVADSNNQESAVDELNSNGGRWGGIYILDNGTLNIDGAIITGAYDGIILYNNADKTTLTNCNLKYNEIGLHLYNSYPKADSRVEITGNFLYGVKEDNMANKNIFNNWLFNNGDYQFITNNTYNYYDFKNGLKK